MTEEERDPIANAFAQLGFTNTFNFGDLVRWGPELYYVDSIEYNAERSAEVAFEDVMYGLARVYCDGTFNDYAEVYHGDEDLRLVCRAEFADAFIAQDDAIKQKVNFEHGEKGDGKMPAMWDFGGQGGGTPKKQAPVLTEAKRREKAEVQRRKDYRAKTDELLDEYNRLNEEGQTGEAERVMAELLTRAHVYEEGGSELIADIMSVGEGEG